MSTIYGKKDTDYDRLVFQNASLVVTSALLVVTRSVGPLESLVVTSATLVVTKTI